MTLRFARHRDKYFNVHRATSRLSESPRPMVQIRLGTTVVCRSSTEPAPGVPISKQLGTPSEGTPLQDGNIVTCPAGAQVLAIERGVDEPWEFTCRAAEPDPDGGTEPTDGTGSDPDGGTEPTDGTDSDPGATRPPTPSGNNITAQPGETYRCPDHTFPATLRVNPTTGDEMVVVGTCQPFVDKLPHIHTPIVDGSDSPSTSNALLANDTVTCQPGEVLRAVDRGLPGTPWELACHTNESTTLSQYDTKFRCRPGSTLTDEILRIRELVAMCESITHPVAGVDANTSAKPRFSKAAAKQDDETFAEAGLYQCDAGSQMSFGDNTFKCVATAEKATVLWTKTSLPCDHCWWPQLFKMDNNENGGSVLH